MSSRSLLIKLTVGVDNPEKCAQAFTVGATAVASGVKVTFWLTGEASWFALPGKAEEFELDHSSPLFELRDQILAGGNITLCTQCAKRRNISQSDLIIGIQIAGAGTFIAQAVESEVQALVY